jgi:hypothetical protein
MTELTIKYLNLLHYPLKLEDIIDKINYHPFCNNDCSQLGIKHHKSFLLYLICNGYPFENIILDENPDITKTAKIINMCKYGDYRCIKIDNTEVFEPIGKLYHTSHFTENCGRKYFKIENKCMKNIYDVAQQTLYNISKEILYKHFLLHHTDLMEFDIISYLINISLDLLT